MHYKLVKGLLLSVLSVIMVTGCGHNQKPDPLAIVGPDENALRELMSVTIEARDEMRLLAKTQEALAQKAMTREQHEQRFYNATVIPEGFEKNATFKFVGKASKAAEAIALIAGYKFSKSGQELPNEPWVHINIVDVPLNEALKEIGIQTGDSIRIEIHSKVLRFIYKS